VPHEAKLSLYQVHAVTEGTDAQAEVSVRLEEEGKSVTARGADPTRWSPRPRPSSAGHDARHEGSRDWGGAGIH
jgi:hypothetical protein